MKSYTLNDTVELKQPCVATIGFFDGVHRGHQFLIDQVRNEAEHLGIESTVITFDIHPRQVMNNDFRPELLNTFDEKIFRLSLTNVNNCAILKFNEILSQLSAHDFMEKILCERLNVKVLIIGYDNRFGHNRSESFEDYVKYGKELGIEVKQSQAYLINDVNVSSSVVRSFITEGEVELANKCLGYPYTISGHVVDGEHTGRKLGFRTANVQVDDPLKHIPAGGVYAVKARVGNTMEMKHAMLNIGVRPTFGGTTKQVIEAHLFRFNDNIYGQKISVSFIHRMREERKFKSPDELRIQLKNDYEMVEKQFLEDIEE
jgi:riboflavin kinase / FMN adenylyltransferase